MGGGGEGWLGAAAAAAAGGSCVGWVVCHREARWGKWREEGARIAAAPAVGGGGRVGGDGEGGRGNKVMTGFRKPAALAAAAALLAPFQGEAAPSPGSREVRGGAGRVRARARARARVRGTMGKRDRRGSPGGNGPGARGARHAVASASEDEPRPLPQGAGGLLMRQGGWVKGKGWGTGGVVAPSIRSPLWCTPTRARARTRRLV